MLAGENIIILSDRQFSAKRVPIPILLATSSVHHHLIRKGLRTSVGLVVESAEPREVHHFALLFGSVEIGVPLFFIFFGLATGMPHATNASLTAEVYGTRYLGEIKAMFLPVAVFASALSPMLMGWMIDVGLGLDALLGMNIGLALSAQILVMLVLHYRKPL